MAARFFAACAELGATSTSELTPSCRTSRFSWKFFELTSASPRAEATGPAQRRSWRSACCSEAEELSFWDEGVKGGTSEAVRFTAFANASARRRASSALAAADLASGALVWVEEAPDPHAASG